jgi:O-succinylbenzoic acid--CoA ligase
MQPLNWKSDESYLLLNPRLPEQQKQTFERLFEQVKEFKQHCWVCTSGTTGGTLKLTGLSKKAVLLSAQTVNDHIQSTQADIWINPLPQFHVGGLGIFARSYLQNNKIVHYTEKWNVHSFYQLMCHHSATLTALVPAQVFDLVQNQLTAPQSLRVVIVGGGALHEFLYHKARSLGWPLLPSYGMTECASQVATASLGSLNDHQFPPLQILSHMKVFTNAEKHLCIESKSLFTTYAIANNHECQLFDPKINEIFHTEDKGEVKGITLQVNGRSGDFIKIGGETVSFSRLESILEGVKVKHDFKSDVALILIPDSRLGCVVHLMASETQNDKALEFLIAEYNSEVLPFERIRFVKKVNEIQRSPLHKMIKLRFN